MGRSLQFSRTFKKVLQRASGLTLNLLVPPVCSTSGCGQRRFGNLPVCLVCFRRLERVGNACAECGELDCAMDMCALKMGGADLISERQALFSVDPVFSGLVHGFKYRGQARHISFLAGFAAPNPFWDGAQVLVPVPLHPLRKRERGYNQSEKIARRLSLKFHIPVEAGALVRTRNTTTQTTLDADTRKNNLSGAFAVEKAQALCGRAVVLVDDVYTTGSTLEECARVLHKAGVHEVRAFTLGRVFKADGTHDFQKELSSWGSLTF